MHDDLRGPHVGHRNHHSTQQPIDPVPDWVVLLFKAMAQISKDINHMRQTTQDLVNAVQALADNSAKVDAALEELTTAHEDGDDPAVAAAVQTLVGLKKDQDTHLAAIADAAPAAAAAPADPAATPAAG